MVVRTTANLKIWLWTTVGVLAALLLTGLGWLVLENWVRVSSEYGSSRRQGQVNVLQLHGWLSAFSIFLLGSLTGLHVMPQWRARLKRRSGLLLYCVFVFLAFSGTALYYISHERLRLITSVVHWVVGLAVPTFLAAHLIPFRTKRHRL